MIELKIGLIQFKLSTINSAMLILCLSTGFTAGILAHAIVTARRLKKGKARSNHELQ